jgi:hypothetical protein
MRNIHWKYLIYHGFSTLMIAPFVVQLFMYLTLNNAHQIVGLVEVYPITLIFSLIFSFPTYLILLITDFLCLKKEFTDKQIKIILIVVTLIGIVITFYIIFKMRDLEVMFGYFLTSLATGLMIKLK